MKWININIEQPEENKLVLIYIKETETYATGYYSYIPSYKIGENDRRFKKIREYPEEKRVILIDPTNSCCYGDSPYILPQDIFWMNLPTFEENIYGI